MDKSHAAEIRVGFPESTNIEKIKADITKSIPKDASISVVSGTAKVTILNVPENIEGLTTEKAKERVLKILQQKNPCLLSTEVTVVYIKSHYQNKEKCTVALRLPIPLQKQLLETGKVYYAWSRLNVVERFHVPQCFKCHQFKHKTKDCTSNVLVCKICGDNHDVKECTNREKRFCVNCNNSDIHKSRAKDHHSGERLCPYRLSLIAEQSKN